MSEISTDRSHSDSQRSSGSDHSTEEILSQALKLHRDNRLDEAVPLYEEVLEFEPDNIQACFNLGTILKSAGDLIGAISNFRNVLQLEPDNFQSLYHLANCLRDKGSREEAIALYRQIADLGHAYSDPYYNLGVLYYHQEEYDQAMDCYREVLKIDPTHADSWYNLGIIHFDNCEYEEAAASYEKALEYRPDDVDSLYNLAFTRARQGHYEKAALHYHQAIELSPDDPELHNSLGSILRKMNEPELAETCYRQAVQLKPDYGPSWTNLATILQIQEQYEEAIECYSKAIEFGDHTESADYMMAALTGSNRHNPPHNYVRDLYDSYADSFEKSLVERLSYKAPELLRKTIVELGEDRRSFSKALDVGCGTGLAGELFRDIVDDLAGVDISEKMLAKAEEKNVYDHLFCSDIVEFLDSGIDPDLDLVIAADVFIYLGRLEPFFSSLRKRLKPGGYLLFSTEKLDSEGDYSLLRSGRYSHSESYIKSLADANGFNISLSREVELRKEKDRWLEGFVFALRKTDPNYFDK